MIFNKITISEQAEKIKIREDSELVFMQTHICDVLSKTCPEATNNVKHVHPRDGHYDDRLLFFIYPNITDH